MRKVLSWWLMLMTLRKDVKEMNSKAYKAFDTDRTVEAGKWPGIGSRKDQGGCFVWLKEKGQDHN